MTGLLVISDRDARKIRLSLIRLNTKLDHLSLHVGAQYMALADDLNAFANRVDLALTGLAGDLHALKDSIQPGPLTAAEGDAIKAKLEALAARAEGLDAETPAV